ncbi:hypothetical protein Pen01_13830 [Phytomonospora endophytica]|nr:hypothetical protein Pen01_13830 [Phytomonospora endophytica]
MSAAGALTRFALLGIELAVLAAAVLVVAERISPPSPPASCAAVPADLGSVVGIGGPAPVYYVDEDESVLVCQWRVQDVPDSVEVMVYSPGRWSAESRFAELRGELESGHEAHPAPELGPEAFSVEQPDYGELDGVVLTRVGDLIARVTVHDGDPLAVDAEDLALGLAARVVSSLREVA